MLIRKFIGGLEMRKNCSISLGDLKFKIPSRKDEPPALKYHPLTPRQYLNLIETGIKLLPDLEAARKWNMSCAPKTRFKLD